MSERDGAGLSRLDADRAHSMEDEGGASAARVENDEACQRRSMTTMLVCLAGVAAGAGLIRLWRSR